MSKEGSAQSTCRSDAYFFRRPYISIRPAGRPPTPPERVPIFRAELTPSGKKHLMAQASRRGTTSLGFPSCRSRLAAPRRIVCYHLSAEHHPQAERCDGGDQKKVPPLARYGLSYRFILDNRLSMLEGRKNQIKNKTRKQAPAHLFFVTSAHGP